MKQVYEHKACRHMLLKVVITVLAAILALAAGCAAQEVSGKPGDPAKGLRSVIYPPEGLSKFSEEQMTRKELQVTRQWQTVTFHFSTTKPMTRAFSW